jgi:Flp pilus assembly protein TadD
MTASVPGDPGAKDQSLATAERMMRMGDTAMAAGDAKTALTFYSRAVWLDSDNYPLMIQLGDALNSLNAYPHAAEAYRKALEVAPRDTEALRGLGNALLAQNRPLLAREQYEVAIGISDDPKLFGAIGITLDMTADHKAAQGYYRKGLEKDPSDLTLLNNLALSLMLDRQYAEAISTLSRVTADPRSTVRHRQNLAMVYGVAGRKDDARRVGAMDYDATTVNDNLAFYELLRAMPNPEKYLLGPDSQRMAMVRQPETPTPPPHDHRAAVKPKPKADDAAEVAPLPAPDIDREEYESAVTPAALPPVAPMQLDVPVRAWKVPEADLLKPAAAVDMPDPAAPAPAGPIDLTAPVESTKPADPSTQTDPTAPAGPVEQAAPALDDDPAQEGVPAAKVAPADPAMPDDPADMPNPMIIAGLAG